MIGIGDVGAQRHHIEAIPILANGRHILIHCFEGIGNKGMIACREWREIGHVLQRHGAAFPERTHIADIGDVIAHSLHRVLEAIQRTTIGFTPIDAVGIAAIAQQLIHLRLEDVLHHRNPEIRDRMAGSDGDIQRRLRAAVDGKQGQRRSAQDQAPSKGGHSNSPCCGVL